MSTEPSHACHIALAMQTCTDLYLACVSAVCGEALEQAQQVVGHGPHGLRDASSLHALQYVQRRLHLQHCRAWTVRDFCNCMHMWTAHMSKWSLWHLASNALCCLNVCSPRCLPPRWSSLPAATLCSCRRLSAQSAALHTKFFYYAEGHQSPAKPAENTTDVAMQAEHMTACLS